MICKSQEDEWRGLESWDASYGWISGPDSTINSSLVRKYTILIADGLIMVNFTSQQFSFKCFPATWFQVVATAAGASAAVQAAAVQAWLVGVLTPMGPTNAEQLLFSKVLNSFGWAIFFSIVS